MVFGPETVAEPAPEGEIRQRKVPAPALGDLDPPAEDEVDLFALSPEQVAIYDREQRLAIANQFGIKNVDSRWGGFQIFLARIYLLMMFGYHLFMKARDVEE